MAEKALSYESKRCNIVMLGITGAGKTTVANRILRHSSFVLPAETLTANTQEVSCGERVIPGPNDVMYSVKIVDTMGFSDPQKDDDDTFKKIKMFFRENVVEGVALVLFIMKHGTVTDEVIKMVKRIEENFTEISPMSALVLTHCENKTPEAREVVVEEFKSDKSEDLSFVSTFMRKGIYTVGFPDPKTTIPSLMEVYQEGIEADVQTLHKLIYKSTHMNVKSELLFDDGFWDRVKQSEVVASNPAKPESQSLCVIS